MAGGRAADSRLRAEAVEPFRDYRRLPAPLVGPADSLWGDDPPPIRIVGVIQGTDDTGSATAELQALVRETTSGAGPSSS